MIRVNFNLDVRTNSILLDLEEKTGYNKTEVLTKGIQIYSLVHRLTTESRDGSLNLLNDDGTVTKIQLI